MAINYTKTEDSEGRRYERPIVRGMRWPPGGINLTIRLIKSSGWENSEDTWTWTLLLARATAGGATDLMLTAETAAIDGTYLVLTFYASEAGTTGLAGRARETYRVDLKSEDASGVESVWPMAYGTAIVRDPVGTVS